MELTKKTISTLRPSEGYVLTQKGDVPDSERVFTEVLHLGSKDSAENWKEVTAEEAEAFRQRVREEQEARAAEEERERRRRELEAELAELNGGVEA